MHVCVSLSCSRHAERELPAIFSQNNSVTTQIIVRYIAIGKRAGVMGMGMKQVGVILTFVVLMAVGAVTIFISMNQQYVHAEGTTYVDMRTWNVEGVSGGNWVDPDNVSEPFQDAESGRTVFQTVNNTSGTMFFVSNETNFINRAVLGTIKVHSSDSDDDWVGFAVGYQNNEGGDNLPEEYIGFSWNQGGTSPYSIDGDEGIYLIHANPPEAGSADPVGAGATVIDKDTGASAGWDHGNEYQFRIYYTTNLIRVYIDDVLRLEATADDFGLDSFEGGQYGFTNASQADVEFGNIRTANASAIDSEPVAADDNLYYGLTYGSEGDTFDTDNEDSANGILANDYDPDGDAINIRLNGVLLDDPGESTIVTGDEGGSFEVFTSGRMIYTAPTGYESKGPYFDSIVYELVDEDGSDTATATISVQETNTPPDDIVLTDASTSSTNDIRIGEGAAPDTLVGTLATVEDTVGEVDQYDYELVDASGGAFTVDGDQLLVRDTAALDTVSAHTITVRTTDTEGQSLTKDFTINVDENAKPTSADISINVDATIPFEFTTSDFAFDDEDSGDTLSSIEITDFPDGSIFVDDNQDGIADNDELLQVNFNDVVTRQQLDDGKLKYNTEVESDTTDSFEFKVSDGQAYSSSGYTVTINVDADIDDNGIPNTTDEGNDSDSIDRSVEDSAPNNGDANNDGKADGLQSNVASYVNTTTNHYTTLEADSRCGVTSVSSRAESVEKDDEDFSYPVGLMDFTLNCGTEGFTATIKQYYYDVEEDDYTVRKYSSITEQYTTISDATVEFITVEGTNVMRVTYQVTDGSELDDDGEVNGVIVDPAGPAVLSDSNPGAPNTGLKQAISYNELQRLLGVLLITGGITVFLVKRYYDAGNPNQ